MANRTDPAAKSTSAEPGGKDVPEHILEETVPWSSTFLSEPLEAIENPPHSSALT